MTNTIDKTPHNYAVHTDLRMLQNAEVWYCAKIDHYMRGTLVRLVFDRHDKIVKGSMNCVDYHFGPNWRFDDKPYGKDKIGSWCFSDPNENTRIFMHNLGYDMTEEDMKPFYTQLKELTDPPDPTIADRVIHLMEKEKEIHEVQVDVGDSTTGDTPVVHSGAKHNKARTAQAS
jgi:hypothetical protein